MATTRIIEIDNLNRQMARRTRRNRNRILRQSKRLILRLKFRREIRELLNNIREDKHDLIFYGVLLIGLAVIYSFIL
jgi:hypothetical protein